MGRILWSQAYSVNINSIDVQHKKLFEMINNFYDSLKVKKNNEALLEVLKSLKNYTVYHFNTEEALMKQYNFVGLRRHKEEHDRFKEEITSIENKVREGKMVLSLSVTGFLESWVKNHINKTDKEYSGFLNSRGIN